LDCDKNSEVLGTNICSLARGPDQTDYAARPESGR